MDRRLITIALVGMAVSAALYPLPSNGTDGSWIGELVTERSGRWICSPKSDISFVTKRGKVSGKIGRSKLSGEIDPSGKIRARATVGSSVGYEFSLRGQVEGEEGSGSWRTGGCSGSWSARLVSRAIEEPSASVTTPAPNTASIEPDQVKTFRDCAACPEMVVIPAGTFVMGSPGSETRWENVPDNEATRERPQHHVTIGRQFALGRYEVTRAEFAAFVTETGYEAQGCYYWTGRKWKQDPSRNWREPGFPQTDRDPVTCVSWVDAQRYVAWLSRKTGQEYRLPSEAEWEYAARAGVVTARYWGEGRSKACVFSNASDFTLAKQQKLQKSSPDIFQCNDGYAYTAPVGSFGANGFGLHDVLGNVAEWVEDCWNETYRGAPLDGTAWTSGNCGVRVYRGGAWFGKVFNARLAARSRDGSAHRIYYTGFRVARTLP